MRDKILVVDDELPIRRLVSTGLSSDSLEIIESATAAEGLKAIAVQAPVLLLLDLGLPDSEGIDVIREIRGWSQIPIIILSARDQDTAKVAALDAGADDYLTKPFSLKELDARIRVALRKTYRDKPQPTYSFGAIKVDFTQHLVHRNDLEVHLTPTEFRLLALLIQHRGRVLTHRQILTAVWGQAYVRQTHYLRVFMGQLRKKLEHDPAQPQFITNEPGIGYRLKVDE